MAKDGDFANKMCPLIHKSEVAVQDGVRTLRGFRERDPPLRHYKQSMVVRMWRMYLSLK